MREKTTLTAVPCQQYLPRRYHVIKINKWGRKQSRVLALDRQKEELHSFDPKRVLKRQLPLRALLQMEKSVSDGRRMRLVFAEEIATQVTQGWCCEGTVVLVTRSQPPCVLAVSAAVSHPIGARALSADSAAPAARCT